MGKNVFGEPDGVVAVESWLEKVGMSHRLRGFSVNYNLIEEMAELAEKTSELSKAHPSFLNAAAIAQIYRDSY